MNENLETNEENKNITDPMLLAYFDGTEPEQQISEEQKLAAEESKRKEEEELTARLEEERLAKEQEEEVKKQQEAELQAKIKEEQEKEKPKRWDEGLDEKAKFILDKLSKGEDKDVYELLKNKFGYENLTEEQKALTFLQEKNPHLDHDDLVFKLAEEFGIGATKLSEDEIELLSDSQKAELRRQEIAKKGLLNEATKYFSEKSADITIPSLPNPLDDDEEYKEYKIFKQQQEQDNIAREEALKQQEIEDNKLIEQVNTTALSIDTLPIELNIDLDQGEFVLKSEFKLDEAKKKQLAEYALDYTPTQAEIKAYQDQNGKLDMKGYMTALAERLFSRQIQKAALKQAIAKDREEFTERELKNTTLRNNSEMQFADREEAFEVSAMRQ